MKRLALALVGCCALAAAQPSPQDVDLEAKYFWAAPSLQRFVNFGEVVERTVTPEQGRLEEETGKPQRPPQKHFEAIKKRLADGIVVSEPVSSRPGPWTPEAFPDPIEKALKRAQLPDVRPSFLGDSEPFVIPLRPFTLADQFIEMADALSAAHRTPLRMTVLGPSRMGTHGMYGVYDVGLIGITFAKPVRIQGLTAAGAPTGADIASMRADFTTNCGEPGLDTINVKSINAGWRGAILAWIGKPPVGTARIGTRQINGKDQYEKLVIEMIDIDRDGVLDFWVFSGLEAAVASTDTFWKAVYGNVGGKWVLLAFAQEADCT